VADVAVYEGLVDQMEYKGFVGMTKMVSVLLPMSASQLNTFSGKAHHPIVVDTVDMGIADHYAASKDTVVLVDGAGYVRYRWPVLQVRGAEKDKPMLSEKLVELVNQLL